RPASASRAGASRDPVVLHAAGRDRGVGRDQLLEGFALLFAGDEEEDLAGLGEGRGGEGHAGVALVGGCGDRDAVCASGPRPRWTRSRRSGSEVSYSWAAASRSRLVTGIGRSVDWWSIERPR